MGPERAVGAGFASSSGLGSYRSMLGMQYHQLRAQRQQQHLQQQQQQQQQHQQQQQAGLTSVDPSGMSGPHALLTSGLVQLCTGAPVRSAATAASKAAVQAAAAMVHLRGPAAYSPFRLPAADAAGIAAQVQQQREAERNISSAAGANAGPAGRPQNATAAEGTVATNDVAFPGNTSELRQHRFRQIPPRQILEVPAASAAAAAQPDLVDNTHPGSSAGAGIPGHLPISDLAAQDETDRARIRKRNRLGQWEAASTSASQHDRFSQGSILSAGFKPPRLLSQGPDEPLNAQPQGTVGHPKGQFAGAMPPLAPRQSADRATDRNQSLQSVPASRQDQVSRSMRLVERFREKQMLSSEDDLIHRLSSRLQKACQPPFASDQQPMGEPCNKGPASMALNGGAGSTHMAEGRT